MTKFWYTLKTLDPKYFVFWKKNFDTIDYLCFLILKFKCVIWRLFLEFKDLPHVYKMKWLRIGGERIKFNFQEFLDWDFCVFHITYVYAYS
jgi:hypothetical protein